MNPEDLAYSPLSGEEIIGAISACCEKIFKQLKNTGDFDVSVVWPFARWSIHVEVEYAANIYAQPKSIHTDVRGQHQGTDQKGNRIETDESKKVEFTVTEDAELPGLIREQIEQAQKHQIPVHPNLPSTVNPPHSRPVESIGAKPEMLAQVVSNPHRRPRGRPRILSG